jgi:hypothetical protein
VLGEQQRAFDRAQHVADRFLLLRDQIPGRL